MSHRFYQPSTDRPTSRMIRGGRRRQQRPSPRGNRPNVPVREMDGFLEVEAKPGSENESFEEVDANIVKNEFKFLESRIGLNGYAEVIEAGAAPPKEDRSHKYGGFTYVSTMYFNENGLPYQRSIDIQSKPVKQLLSEMIVDYPGVSFSTAQITLHYPIRVLWYYQKELKEAAAKEKEKEEETELAQHLDVLIKFLDDEFQATNEEHKNLTEKGLIDFNLLWTIFRPGSLMYTKILTQPRVLKLISHARTETGISLKGAFVDYDGTKFGEGETEVQMSGFAGTRKIQDLSVIPFDLVPDKDAIAARLIERGNKFVSLKGCHCKKYNGVAVAMTMCGPAKVPVNSRVMIDAHTHATVNPNSAKVLLDLLRPADKAKVVDSDDFYEEQNHSYGRAPPRRHTQGLAADFKDPAGTATLELTDKEKLLCTAVVWGFSLGSKSWLQFFVDDIEDVVWNTDSFSKLVLPAQTKELICGLVESHITDHAHFDDFVEGKGKGLISVLHGAPGLGKTMTAETVAEYTRSPLYTVSAGSLGTEVTAVEKNLDRILQLCTIWKAVLLLDEADVYLEQRSLHDIQRNALVSVFLRLLEYYHGILFLTSNRVETFDEAIQSRIHIAIRYNDLLPEARGTVWRNFIAKIEGSGTATAVAEEDYAALALIPLNGRQIKNATRTALGIADRKGEKLQFKHLKMVLGVVDTFEREMAGVKKE